MRKTGRVGLAIVASYAAGFFPSYFIDSQGLAWYEGLAKPLLTPPSWVFPPVWLVLYGLMGLAFGLVWLKPRTREIEAWMCCFFIQLVFNVSWTVFFFDLHVLLISFADAMLLAISLLVITLGAWPHDRRATYLLLPSLAWVSFAAYLSGMFWYLN